MCLGGFEIAFEVSLHGDNVGRSGGLDGRQDGDRRSASGTDWCRARNLRVTAGLGGRASLGEACCCHGTSPVPNIASGADSEEVAS